jgi:hypothetical protein
MGLYPVDFETALRGSRRVWFVIFQTAIDQAVEDGIPHGNILRLDATMACQEVVSFGDLRLLRYETR